MENEMTIRESLPPNNVVFHLTENGAQVEMLRIAPDGFYVRGVKLERDDGEARAVFEAFRAWCIRMGMFAP